MTLNEIIVASLLRLNRGTDTQTIRTYRDVFTDSANKAIRKIALRYKQSRKETIVLSDGSFNVRALSRNCIRIDEVRSSGKAIDFWQDPPGSGIVFCNTESNSVDVVYRYLPERLSSTTDTPDLPEYAHDLIVHYVVACERCGGDPGTQGTASADFQMFQTGLAELGRSNMGEPRSYKLLNY